MTAPPLSGGPSRTLVVPAAGSYSSSDWAGPQPATVALRSRFPPGYDRLGAAESPAWEHLPMDENDPEKRIADLERQLADLRAAGDPGANQGAPPAWTPSPAAFNDSQRAAFPPPPQAGFPPPVEWPNPAQQAPSNYWQPPASAGSTSGRRVWIFLAAGISILVLVIVGVGVAIALNSAKLFTSTAPTQAHSASGPSTKSSKAPGPRSSSAAGPSASAAAGPTQLHTVDGLNGLFGTIRSQFGDTMGYRLVVYPDYAVLTRED